MSAMPAMVIAIEPTTCRPMIAAVQPYWPRVSSVVASPEKVENVV